MVVIVISMRKMFAYKKENFMQKNACKASMISYVVYGCFVTDTGIFGNWKWFSSNFIL